MDSRVRSLDKIEPQPGAPAQARRIIAEELSSRLPHGILEDIKLMVSELVTNGVVDARNGVEAPVMLDLCVNGDVRCRVIDHGAGFATRVERAFPTRRGWWGLRLVRAAV